MTLPTPLHDAHVAAGGNLVDSGGRLLPIDYGSQIDEHHAVRRSAGVFDVSQLTIIDIAGEGARDWLRIMLANDVGKLDDGEALYGCLCNERGGIVDDLIAYRLTEHRWRLIANAATRERDVAWLEGHCPSDVTITTPDELTLLAVQGPEAVELAASALAAFRDGVPPLANLPRFGFTTRPKGSGGSENSADFAPDDLFISRTGYTGEDGVEITLPSGEAPALWEALLGHGVRPCGLSSRETLRIEAGMSAYGVDLDDSHTPVESGIGWTVDLSDRDRDFLGRERISSQMEIGAHAVRVGLVLISRGIMRGGQMVQLAGRDVGVVTSGTFSPTRECSIAFARVERAFKGNCDVIVRNQPLPARTGRLPFVRNGEATD